MPDSTTPQEGERVDREVQGETYKHQPLNYDTTEQRFLILQPCTGDKNDETNKVHCSIETVPLADAPPFIAVRNSRGYRLIPQAISVDNKDLFVPIAVETFLRNYRRDDGQPVRLWLRHICLIEEKGEESSRYWNRPFLERMYKQATDVIDMTAFNTELLEAGTIVPVYDSRYAKWEKEWNKVLVKTPLPKVFPLRVGNTQSFTAPTDRYAYVPLDLVTQEIRLLVLHPNKDPSATINIHLAHNPIQSEVSYQAVSYTWGRVQPTTDIIVNGQLLAVTVSLDQFLRSIRPKGGSLVLWIDAICIDQSNDLERNRHLPRMAEVYETAVSVIASLGDMDEDARLAMDFIPKLQSPLIRINDDNGWDIGKPGEFSSADLARLFSAAYSFLTRPYFHRVWILQEIAWASSPFGVCGTHSGFSFWQLENAARNIQDMLKRDPALAEKMMKASSSGLKIVDPGELEFIRKMFYFRHLISRGEGSLSIAWSSLKISQKSPGFLEAAVLARSFEATDPHDKVFALWTLAQDRHGLKFDMAYTDSVPVSFTKLAKAWVLQHKSLDIIATTEMHPKSEAFYSSAPSWSSDWSVPSTASSLVRREFIPRRVMMAMDALDGELYSADGRVKYEDFDEPLFSFDGYRLLCTGIIVDQLEGFVSHDPKHEAVLVFVQAVKMYYSDREKSPYQDPLQAVWAMCHGDVPSTWAPRADDQNSEADFLHKNYKGNRGTARHFYQYVTDIGTTESLQVIRAVLAGRVLGFTKKGYMCLLPHWVASTSQESEEARGPWLLAVLAGCSTPVILQQLEDDSYRIAGSVFVQGWMEGEFIEEMMGAESAKSFWASRLKDKMCIV